MSTLADVVSTFADELGGPPRLGEFLEILGLAVPGNNKAAGDLPMPLVLKAKAGNRNYRDAQPSRIGELNDATFVAASDALAGLAEQVAAGTGVPAVAPELAAAIHQAIQDEGLRFADIAADGVSSLTVEGPKRRIKAQPGDIVAIPVGEQGYRMAVMVTRDRRGMALGLFTDPRRLPRPGALDPARVRRFPVYTGEHSIADGSWSIVGHDEALLAAFPSDPEVYHWPDPTWPGIGPFGSAETAADVLRDISEAEAREVGLLDGTYVQVYLATELQAALADGTL